MWVWVNHNNKWLESKFLEVSIRLDGLNGNPPHILDVGKRVKGVYVCVKVKGRE